MFNQFSPSRLYQAFLSSFLSDERIQELKQRIQVCLQPTGADVATRNEIFEAAKRRDSTIFLELDNGLVIKQNDSLSHKLGKWAIGKINQVLEDRKNA